MHELGHVHQGGQQSDMYTSNSFVNNLAHNSKDYHEPYIVSQVCYQIDCYHMVNMHPRLLC
jgi:hypothetical protein